MAGDKGLRRTILVAGGAVAAGVICLGGFGAREAIAGPLGNAPPPVSAPATASTPAATAPGVVAAPPSTTVPAPVIAAHKSQFLLIIDDSGSMTGTDRNRLAILAARSLVSLLDDQEDSVAVAGMNELAEDINSAQLRAPSDALRADSLGANGSLSRFEGAHGTPCGAALANAKKVLLGWAPQGANQYLLFLTDGGCSDTVEPPTQWLAGLGSATQPFKFSFMGIGTEPKTDELRQYASQSGGVDADIKLGNPSEIIGAFADFYKNARGYHASPESCDQSQRRFPKAHRLRAIALRRDASKPLTIAVDGVPKTGETFQNGSNQSYAFATVVKDSPKGSAIDIKPSGHESCLLIPEYKQPRVDLSLSRGDCSAADKTGPVKGTLLPNGSRVCARVALAAAAGNLNPAQDLDFCGFLSADSNGKRERVELRWQPSSGVFEGEYQIKGAENDLFTLTGVVDFTACSAPGRAKQPASSLESAAQPFRIAIPRLEVKVVGGASPDRVASSLSAGGSQPIEISVAGSLNPPFRMSVKTVGAIHDHPCLKLRLEPEGGDSLDFEVAAAGQHRKLVLEAAPDCRGPDRATGAILFDALKQGTPPAKLDLDIVFESTPWWRIWGPRLLGALSALFGLVTVGCIINGWRKPALRLPAGRRALAYYFARDLKLVSHDNVTFRAPNQDMGAYPIDEHLRGHGGWYRNAAVHLGERGCRIPCPLRFDLELQPGRSGRFRAVLEPKASLWFATVDVDSVRRPAEAYTPLDLPKLARPTLGAQVGPLCQLYARLLGRMPAVRSMAIEDGIWYAVGPDADQPTYFFKLDVLPAEPSGENGHDDW